MTYSLVKRGGGDVFCLNIEIKFLARISPEAKEWVEAYHQHRCTLILYSHKFVSRDWKKVNPSGHITVETITTANFLLSKKRLMENQSM